MADLLQVKCPECDCILFVKRATGEVVEVRKPIAGQQEGEDRFEALMRKSRTRGDDLMKKFEDAKQKEKNKIARLESLFKETKDRVEQSGDTGPAIRDMDMD